MMQVCYNCDLRLVTGPINNQKLHESFKDKAVKVKAQLRIAKDKGRTHQELPASSPSGLESRLEPPAFAADLSSRPRGSKFKAPRLQAAKPESLLALYYPELQIEVLAEVEIRA